MSHDEDIEARLARLSAATDGVGPRGGFSQRVMARIAEERASNLAQLGLPARRFFPLGMLAAALAVFWAVSVNQQVDEAIASSDDTEISW